MKKKSKQSKKKRSKSKILKDKIWSIFSEYVRKRDKYTCYTCGKVERPGQAGHYLHGKLDYDPMNIHCQCLACNHFKSGNLGVYAERLIKEYGIDKVEDLRRRANIIWKPSVEELEDLYEYWKNELEKL